MDTAQHRPTASPMARRISCSSPRPLARDTTMAPPVASDMNTSDTRLFTVPTMDTAAMAASPMDDTSAVDSRLMKQIKNWSSVRVMNIFLSSE